ncbi:MAG: hypothetical protein AB7U82_14560 [Blastocatellales bacterium]
MKKTYTLFDYLFQVGVNSDQLLPIEKERRGALPDALVFIGMHDLAQMEWCAMQSWFRNKEKEPGYFGAYLADRLERLQETVGIEKRIAPLKLLEQIARLELVEPKGTRRRKIGVPPKSKACFSQSADPYERGRANQSAFAEKYATVRWGFEYSRYVALGIPDGLARDFVYEFKTTRRRAYLVVSKRIAELQGDLYGLFFKRPRKRIQILAEDANAIETFESDVNAENAHSALARFEEIDSGKLPAPAEYWKCRVCAYREQCAIKRG